jgi:hypothetical protein
MPPLAKSENVCTGCRSRKKKCDVSLPSSLVGFSIDLKHYTRANVHAVHRASEEVKYASTEFHLLARLGVLWLVTIRHSIQTSRMVQSLPTLNLSAPLQPSSSQQLSLPQNILNLECLESQTLPLLVISRQLEDKLRVPLS